ncbi:TPA: hypothetical protein LR339_004592 [Enterobacter hormaechei]|nr:hypothetical protein [Enterobacter hormaechei]
MTLTKEWLLKTIAELEEERDAVPGVVNEDAAMALVAMKLAMASLEAEPVAYMYKDNLHSDARFSLHTRFGNWSQEDINEYEITEIPLYAAPPAAVSVPEWTNEQCLEFLSIAFRHAEIKGDLELDDIRLGVKMVNGSRAAMLQGAEPVTTANKLPAIGWLRADYQDDNRGLRGNAPLFVLGKKDPSTVWGLDYVPLTSNSPVIPDGWVMVPEEPTHEMLEAGDEQFGTYDVYRRMIAASPQQEV